jgi:uncharacterized protein
MQESKGTVLITGASSGIGYELAKLFAGDKYETILVARNEDRLREVAAELLEKFGTKVQNVALDLAQPGAAKILFDHLDSKGVVVDILVNNAGFGVHGAFAGMEEDEILGQISLNITALTQLTRFYLPGMLARRGGKIMNVASTAAFQPGPLMAVYFATKAYVLSLTEALTNEVGGSGVTVCCLCPGATDTGFQKRAGMENSRLFKKVGAMKVDAVARAGYEGLMAGKTLVIPGIQNWVSARFVGFAPRKLATAIARWTSEQVN